LTQVGKLTLLDVGLLLLPLTCSVPKSGAEEWLEPDEG
jgi:hypothetical protein